MITLHTPQTFPGTEAEKTVNYRTHVFGGEDYRCLNCDCRAGGTVSEWPCGASVPTIVRTV